MTKKAQPVDEVQNPEECPHDSLTVRLLTISHQPFSKQPDGKYRQQTDKETYFEEVLTVKCAHCNQAFNTDILH